MFSRRWPDPAGTPCDLSSGMKRILVALDASPRAPGVLAAASQLAELTGVKLVVYRAIGIPPGSVLVVRTPS